MKKLIFIITLFSLWAGAFDASARYKGDLNGDDRVDLADMVFLAKAIKVGSTDNALDVNASGKVDDYDLQKLADIIISGKLTEDSGLNVGIGGWDDSGEDFGGTVKAPAINTRIAEETRFYMNSPRSEGNDHYSMEFGISEGNEAPCAIFFNIRLPRELNFDQTKIVELESKISTTHKLYGSPKFIKENEEDYWSAYVLRFIVMAPDLTSLPISMGKLGRIHYSADECWSNIMFTNCQVALSTSDGCIYLEEHWGGYDGNFKPVEVSSLWFDQSEMYLTEGDEGWLYTNIDPWDATDQSLIWTSSDESVASVQTDDGRNATIKALKEGETTITATASNGVSASCNVRVDKRFIDVQGIYLSEGSHTMTEGDSFTLYATIDPEDATDKDIAWHSSDEGIAVVNANGAEATITAMAQGYVEIYASASNGMQACCQINVEKRIIEITEVVLDRTELSLFEGDNAQLNATINPSDATDQTLIWTSSDELVATVSDNGVVHAVNHGQAVITVSSSNGVSDQCIVNVEKRIIEVTEVVLDQTELSLIESESATLTATVNPSDATDRSLIWKSSDESVATVSTNGEVKALKPGTATITVSSANGKSATCTVTVERKIVEVTGIILNTKDIKLTEGESATLIATIQPADATDKSLTWTSSNTAVAMVSANGEVKAIKAGSAVITVKAANGVSATCNVTVESGVIAVASVTLDKTELNLTEGESAQLTATVNPSDATDKSLTWKSSDESVAIVSTNGEVKALKPGTATISVSSANGKSATCTVTVERKIVEVTGIILSATEMKLIEGESATLIATIQPADATDKSLTWTSSNTAVATVSANGEVKALKAGSAVITVKAANGISATCVVNVEAKVIEMEAIQLDTDALSLIEGETHQFIAAVIPAETTYPDLEWWVDDEAIATVEQNGLVTMLREGETTVHVRSVYWPDVEASCHINVISGVEGLIEDNAPCDVYSTNGVLLKKDASFADIDNLSSGIYIIRQGQKTTKLLK